MTSLVSSPFTNFAGGLQLVDQASEYDSSFCLDDYNVRFGQSGEVRTRPGTVQFSGTDEADAIDSLAYTEAVNNKRVLSSAGALLRAVDLSGGSIATGTPTAPGPFSFAAFGAPTQERVYGVNGTDLVYWDGLAWVINPTVSFDNVAGSGWSGSAGAQSPRGHAAVVSPWDNRLMIFGFDEAAKGPNGALGSPSTMFYSEQGDPEKWKVSWRETMTPGDGERLVAAVLWRDRIFAFKQTKFFVYYGATSDGFGNPRQQYFTVDTGCGVDGPLAVCAGRDGVYFVDSRGVYRTDGNEPELVSGNLEPLFSGLDAPFYVGPMPDTSHVAHQGSLTFCNERLHMGIPTTLGYASFVFDPRYGWWTADDIPIRCGAVLPNVDGERLLFGKAGTNRIWSHGGSLVGDAGVGYDSRWRSSWQTFGVFGEKILHRIRLWGAGLVSVGCATDFGAIERAKRVDLRGGTDLWEDGTNPDDLWSDGTDARDLWGSGESYRDGWASGDWRGSVHSIQIASLDRSPFSVQRFENHLGVMASASSDYVANAAA